MRSVLLSLAILLLAGVASGQDLSVTNDFVQSTVVSSSEMNTNFEDVENSVNAVIGNTFYAENYATGSNSGGLHEAVDACEATDAGGLVFTHSSGTVTIDRNNPDTTVTLTKCSIRGLWGGHVVGATAGDLPDGDGPSHYHLINAGRGTFDPFIRVHGNDLQLKDFAVSARGEDADTVIIYVAGQDIAGGYAADGTPGSSSGMNNLTIENLSISGSGSPNGTDSGSEPPAAAGTGLFLHFALKSEVMNSEIRRFDKAVRVLEASNSTTIMNTSLRESRYGIFFSDDRGGESSGSDFAIVASTIEGGQVGMYAEYGTEFKVSDFGTHYEQSLGPIDERANILIEAFGFNYYGKGIHFGGQINPGRDFVRTIAQFNTDGIDVIENARWKKGATLASGGVRARLNVKDSWRLSGATFVATCEDAHDPGGTGDPDGLCDYDNATPNLPATGNDPALGVNVEEPYIIDGSVITHGTDCRSHVSGRQNYLRGARCYQIDNGQWYVAKGSTCVDQFDNVTGSTQSSGGPDGICDSDGITTGLKIDDTSEIVRMNAARSINLSTATYTALDDELWNRSQFYCTNAGCDVTLPSAQAGMHACFYDQDGGGVVTLDPNGSETIELGGSVLTGGNAIDSLGARGDALCLISVVDDAWIAIPQSGTWVDGGAD